MRLVIAIVFCFGLLKMADAQAQTEQASEKKVVFDPLFWKDELKLTAGQYLTIRSINEEYYQGIIRVVNDNTADAETRRTVSEELLEVRSEKIWSTFHNKQKKKWKEISAAYYNPTLASSESSKDNKF